MTQAGVRSDCIYDGPWLKVRAMMRRDGGSPALDWTDGLDKKGQGQLIAACEVLETTLRSGRPPAGRAERIKNSETGLWELKVTKPGSTPPHLRVLFIREGQTLWVADGLTKQQNVLTSKDVAYAETIAGEWIKQHQSKTNKSNTRGQR